MDEGGVKEETPNLPQARLLMLGSVILMKGLLCSAVSAPQGSPRLFRMSDLGSLSSEALLRHTIARQISKSPFHEARTTNSQDQRATCEDEVTGNPVGVEGHVLSPEEND